MISCTFEGRLGNNLFQLATALKASEDLNSPTIFPFYTQAGHRGKLFVDLSLFNFKFNRGEIQTTLITEEGFHYKPITYPPTDFTLKGFFQSWEYFESIKEDLINTYFKFNPKITEYIDNKYGKLIDENSLAVSVRRGDYLKLQNNHCVLSPQYYQETLTKHFSKGVSNIFVFSDDFNYCKKLFGESAIMVQENSSIQLALMARFSNHIMANSTFSWWGSYLNPNPKKIIIPDPWFGPSNSHLNTEGLYPSYWTKHSHNIVYDSHPISQDEFYALN